MKTVVVEHDYAVPAAQLWALLVDFDVLTEVMHPTVTFEGLPSGRVETGQKIDVMVSLFGKLPSQPYHMEVLECDDQRKLLRSFEHGAGVKSWRHTLTLTETVSGCHLRDQIEIEAGLKTPIVALWARYVYSVRHKRRLAILARQNEVAK